MLLQRLHPIHFVLEIIMDYSVIVLSWMTIVLAGKLLMRLTMVFIILSISLIEVDAVTLTPNLGELCPGQDVVLTCSTTDGDVMNWLYDGMNLDTGGGFLPSDPISTTRDVMESGFMFSLELTSRMPEFASTLSFRADAVMNGRSVSCRVAIPLSGGGFDSQEATEIIQIIRRGQR